ncbi:hypothetical protein GCM10010441_23240 [Kitasatospora paracochleata]|uniref:hypothetical protein n=1 Tax=Kitasatospora paracochleata TaxID=58354 RepID=UPI0031D65D52
MPKTPRLLVTAALIAAAAAVLAPAAQALAGPAKAAARAAGGITEPPTGGIGWDDWK